MASMNLGRRPSSALICASFVVAIASVSVPAARAEANATVAVLSTSAIEATTTSNISNSSDVSTTASTMATMLPNATAPNATDLTITPTLNPSSSSVFTNANASSEASTTTSIKSSQGMTSTNVSIPATSTYSSSIDGSETPASSSLPTYSSSIDGSETPASNSTPTYSRSTAGSDTTATSSLPPTTSPGPTSALSSPGHHTATSAAVESTAASTTVPSVPPTTADTSTASTSDAGMTLPVTQIIIISVSSVAGGILVIIIIIGVAVHYRRRRRRRHENPPATNFPSPSVKVPTRSKTVNLVDFTEYVNHLSADSDYGFAEEFEELEDAGTDQSVTAPKEERNRSKNRYTNVLPYDHSRVKLHTSVVSDKSDYINANYIPGHNGPKEFIATQGPLSVTADDFWRMVWEQQCKAIVMLTRCTEGLVDKCHHYWPSGHDPVVYGDVTVQVTDELEQPQWTVTNFSVSLGAKVHSDNADTPQAAVRHVRHFHFTAFPDHRAPPEIESMLQFARMVRSKLQPAAAAGGGGGGPVIVHCSAGVGRTGTFIAIDRLLQQIDEGRASVDVFGLVREMRLHRMFMVQTEEQYIFIHKIILHELQKLRKSASLNGGIDNKAFAVLRCWWHRALTAAADESERSVDRRCCSVLC